MNTSAKADARSAFEEKIVRVLLKEVAGYTNGPKEKTSPAPHLKKLTEHTLHTPNLSLRNIPLLGPTNGAPIMQPNLKKSQAYSAPSFKLPESITVTAQLSSHQSQSPD